MLEQAYHGAYLLSIKIKVYKYITDKIELFLNVTLILSDRMSPWAGILRYNCIMRGEAYVKSSID